MLILVVILIQLYHWELLLQRACPVLLGYGPVLMHVLIPALVVGSRFDHLAVVGAVLLRISLVTNRRFSKSHGALTVSVAAINITITVSIDDLVPIHKDQVSRMGLLDAFRKRLLLVSKDDLLVGSDSTLTPTQWCLNSVLLLLFKASSIMQALSVLRWVTRT